MFLRHGRAGACSAMEARLEDYIEGRLAPREAKEVEVHAGGCGRCAAALDSARLSVGVLAAVKVRPLPKASAFFVGRVMAAVRHEQRDDEAWRPLESAAWRLCWLATAVALVLMVFMLRIQVVTPPTATTAQQTQVQELINVPVAQPAVQDDSLLLAASDDYGR